jgi:hypothetical protein
LVEGSAGRVFWESEGACRVGLGIAIDDESALLGGRQRGAQVYRGGRLTNTALLIGDGNNSRQTNPPDCIANVAEQFQVMQDVLRGTIHFSVPRGTNDAIMAFESQRL